MIYSLGMKDNSLPKMISRSAWATLILFTCFLVACQNESQYSTKKEIVNLDTTPTEQKEKDISLRSLPDSTPAQFPLNKHPKRGEQPKRSDNIQKERLAKKVLDRLWKTAGSFDLHKPHLRIIDDKKIIAQYKPGSNVIELEQKLFEVCANFEKDSLAALAYVIGHELAHVFQLEATNQYKTVPFLAYDKTFPQGIRQEKTADIHGIFLAYLAGYLSSGDIIPDIIKDLYDAFDLHQKQLNNYEGFTARQLIAEEVKQKADTLRHVFEFANHCTRVGLYSLAKSGYRYVLRYYHGAEMYHNLSINNALAAVRMNQKRATSFIYPFELRSHTKLSLVRAQPDQLLEVERKRKDSLLNLALSQIDSAISKMPNQQTAKLHRANILCLMGKYSQALLELSQIEQSTEPSQSLLDKVLLTKALVFINQSKNFYEEGLRILSSLANTTRTPIATLAAFNLAQAKNEEWEISQTINCPAENININRLHEAKNQFHRYAEIPVFQINDFAAIGWANLGEITRWKGQWMGTDQLHLLSISSSSPSKEMKSTQSQQIINLFACPTWMSSLSSSASKNYSIHSIEYLSPAIQ